MHDDIEVVDIELDNGAVRSALTPSPFEGIGKLREIARRMARDAADRPGAGGLAVEFEMERHEKFSQ